MEKKVVERREEVHRTISAAALNALQLHELREIARQLQDVALASDQHAYATHWRQVEDNFREQLRARWLSM